MTDSRPYVGFYRQHGISPVAQDISDAKRHFDRREALYRQLGIPPSLLAGRIILELGPGSGHNSIVTASFKPKRYVLVDGNPFGLESTLRILEPFSRDVDIECRSSLIEEFESDERFDVVLCEGVIPTQRDPSSFNKRLARFVKVGGILVITCMDSVPLASETLRRFISALMVNDDMPIEEKVRALLSVFSDHLKSLKGMSRFPRDWILDNLIHPWVGPLYSIPEAISTLADEFDAYSFSPRFLTDWRWYKDIWGDATRYNELPYTAYLENVHNFIDYRFSSPPRHAEENRSLVTLCDELFEAHRKFRPNQKNAAIEQMLDLLGQLIVRVREFGPATASGFEGCLSALRHFQQTGTLGDFGAFRELWGRGQQYASFIRRTSEQRQPANGHAICRRA
jgi:SAM-dependent methyltransferase